MDTPPLAAAATPALPRPEDGKTRQAAQDFEGMVLNQLLAPMFQTIDDADNPFGGGIGEQTWRPLLVQEIARQLARSGGVGLAEPVYQQMLRLQEAKR